MVWVLRILRVIVESQEHQEVPSKQRTLDTVHGNLYGKVEEVGRCFDINC